MLYTNQKKLMHNFQVFKADFFELFNQTLFINSTIYLK